MKTISTHELNTILKNGEVDLIDVRTPVEFREAHIAQARNVPLDLIKTTDWKATRNADVGKPLYVICGSGQRSIKACDQLSSNEQLDIINVEGGTQAWVQAGFPVTEGKKAMSLERQVRIAAGSLVLLGVILGFTVHPACFGISGFVGAGLTFAGITDTCAMGMLIAKMPWNKI